MRGHVQNGKGRGREGDRSDGRKERFENVDAARCKVVKDSVSFDWAVPGDQRLGQLSLGNVL